MFSGYVYADIFKPIKDDTESVEKSVTVIQKISVESLLRQKQLLQKQMDDLNFQLAQVGKIVDVPAIQKKIDDAAKPKPVVVKPVLTMPPMPTQPPIETAVPIDGSNNNEEIN